MVLSNNTYRELQRTVQRNYFLNNAVVILLHNISIYAILSILKYLNVFSINDAIDEIEKILIVIKIRVKMRIIRAWLFLRIQTR